MLLSLFMTMTACLFIFICLLITELIHTPGENTVIIARKLCPCHLHVVCHTFGLCQRKDRLARG